MLPSIGDNSIRYPLHGPEFLVYFSDGRGVAVEDGGAVVVAMVVGGEGEDETIDVSCLFLSLVFFYRLDGQRGVTAMVTGNPSSSSTGEVEPRRIRREEM